MSAVTAATYPRITEGLSSSRRMRWRRGRRGVRAATVEATPSTNSASASSSSNSGAVLQLQLQRRGREKERKRAEDLQAEVRAMERAVNASVYSPELLASKYGSRPLKVGSFFFQIHTLK